jgi:elongation factor 1-beta
MVEPSHRFSAHNLAEADAFLASNNYLSGGPHPGHEDAHLLSELTSVPSLDAHPNVFHWYALLAGFKDDVKKTWTESKPHGGHGGHAGHGGKGGKKDAKKTEHKEEKAEKTETKKEAADDDLFGDDDPEEAEKLKQIAAKKKEEQAAKKKAVIARSIVIFDVKVFEQEQNLDELAAKILKIEMDGLQWRTEYKLVEIAYGMKKIQIGCTIEDDKIPATDDIFEKILAWEDEVQSIDIVSFQKV